MIRKLINMTILLLSAGGVALHAEDIRSAFLSIDSRIFEESLRPLVVDNYLMDPGKSVTITKKLREKALSTASANGKLDIKNHFVQLSMNTATGLFVRTYVLYFMKDGSPVLVASERNGSSHGEYTKFFALCKINANWQGCPETMFPQITLSSLTKPGVKLDKDVSSSLFLYYDLPRLGTDIKVQVIYDDYMLAQDIGTDAPDGLIQVKNEMKKLVGTEFKLKWNKGENRFVFVP